MATGPLIPNRLMDERLAAGFDTYEQLAAAADLDPEWYAHIEAGHVLPTRGELDRLTAALGGISPRRLYLVGYLGLVGGLAPGGLASGGNAPTTMYRGLADHCHVLLARDEVRWFERQPGPDHQVDVFMNLSCGTQMVPHLLLDTVAVLEKLDVSFVAAAGSAACCGKPFHVVGQTDTADRVNRARIRRTLGWGARVHVNWCVSCQITSTTAAARRFHTENVAHPVREVQVLTFLEERLRELGDRVPWRRRVSRRVLVEGHPSFGPALREAHSASARLLAMVPGVEVIDLYDGHSEASPCTYIGRDRNWSPPAWYEQQDTAEGVREHQARLAKYVRSYEADTVACQQQSCHLDWSRYASDRLAVVHAVSILADALDCAHPDRRQAAIRLGDPDAFLSQTRSVWQSWGISEDRARELATSISDPNFADAATQCTCGAGSCRENLISVDVLTGTTARSVPRKRV